MYQDLIIILGIIFLIYKLITHKGKLTLARIITFLGLAMGSGIALLNEFAPVFVLFFLTIVCMGSSLVGMYFMRKNDECESDKVEKYPSNFKVGVYTWLFLVALYIYLYVLTYY